MLEYIKSDNQILAVILRSSFKAEGISFITPNELTQQIGYMSHPEGHVIQPHVHNPIRREIELTTEVLFIKKGRVRVDLYASPQEYMESRVLESGDFVLLVNGGHGLEILEPTEIIEIKQGPYVGEADKQRFDPVSADQVILSDS